VGQEQSTTTHARTGQRSFSACVTTADNNHVKVLRIKHEYAPGKAIILKARAFTNMPMAKSHSVHRIAINT
jgi:hypothetical protein